MTQPPYEPPIPPPGGFMPPDSAQQQPGYGYAPQPGYPPPQGYPPQPGYPNPQGYPNPAGQPPVYGWNVNQPVGQVADGMYYAPGVAPGGPVWAGQVGRAVDGLYFPPGTDPAAAWYGPQPVSPEVQKNRNLQKIVLILAFAVGIPVLLLVYYLEFTSRLP